MLGLSKHRGTMACRNPAATVRPKVARIMAYRLIALDIDGTIRSTDHAMSDRTRSAIDEVRERGVIVTLATGRTFRSAIAVATELALTSPIISFQGAHVADPETGDVLLHRPLTADMAVAALDVLESWDREVLAYLEDRVYANKLTPWVEAYGERNRGQVSVADDLRSLATKGLTRLVAVGEDADVLGLEEGMRSTFDSRLLVTRSLPYFCEILHREGGKDNALAWLCRRLGIEQRETIAFGNGYNDVDMLRWAELGVAVSGAVPEAIEVADVVAPPLEEDGPAAVLEDLVKRGFLG